MKKKKVKLLFLLFFPMLCVIFVPQSQAEITNIWGVNSGDSRTYRIGEDIRGSVEGVTLEFYVQYTVLSVMDVDANNFTDIIVRVIDLSADSVSITEYTLPDTDPFVFIFDMDGTYINDIIFIGIQNILLLYLAVANPTIYPLVLPITSNTTHGLNWTAALITINGSASPYTDYTGFDQGTRALVTYSANNQYDSNLLAYYNITGTILWDKITGWLISLEYIKTYEEDFGFSIHTSIKLGSPSTISTVGEKRLTDVFAWLGFGVGIIGLCLSYYFYKKMKHKRGN